jgi:hypothetical protein
LVASAPGLGVPSVAVSGNTVFVSDGSVVYVFTEPAGGWSGVESEAAMLTASDGASFNSIAVDGRTLVASAPNRLYVFTEPSSGWSGVIRQAATLAPSSAAFGGFGGPLAISGSTVVASGHSVDENNGLAATYIFSRPPGGWSGTQHQAATLTYAYLGDGQGASNTAVAASQGTVALMTDGQQTAGAGLHECPCNGVLYTLLAPPGGWSGTTRINPTTSVGPVEGPDVSVEGPTVVVGTNDGMRVLTGLPPLTAITQVHMAQLAGPAPGLRFTLTAGTGAPAIKTFILGPPRGLRFSAKHTQLAAGVATAGAGKSTIALHGGELRVTLRHPATKITLTVRSDAWTETPTLSKALESLATTNRSASGHGKRVLHLTLPIRITSTDGQRTAANIEIRVA